jgi:negative regulator of replication initiation
MIILDNASAHKNDTIRDLVNKHNKLLYSVPYQHFSNAIENYFSMLKSKLQKFERKYSKSDRHYTKRTL